MLSQQLLQTSASILKACDREDSDMSWSCLQAERHWAPQHGLVWLCGRSFLSVRCSWCSSPLCYCSAGLPSSACPCCTCNVAALLTPLLRNRSSLSPRWTSKPMPPFNSVLISLWLWADRCHDRCARWISVVAETGRPFTCSISRCSLRYRPRLPLSLGNSYMNACSIKSDANE